MNALIYNDWFLTNGQMTFCDNNKLYNLSPLWQSLLYGVWFPVKGLVTMVTMTLEKSPSTFIIFIKSLSCLNSMMCYEVLLLTKAFPTFITFINLHLVSSLMLCSVILAKSFPTIITVIRFLPHVNSLIFMKCYFWIKAFWNALHS